MLVTFYKLTPGGRAPVRADRSVAGTLPVRALRYCEAVCTASALGYYVFPPLGLTIEWDGTDGRWSFDRGQTWHPLQAAQFPNFRATFDAAAPESCRGYSPPMILRGQSPGIIQIWSGVIARTAPGWSLLVRGPANMVHSRNYMTLEGLIETDRWFGPLFTNIQMLGAGTIYFTPDEPYIQVQPIHREHYEERWLNAFEVKEGLDGLTEADWQSYHQTIVVPNSPPFRPIGGYAIAVRKRRAKEK